LFRWILRKMGMETAEMSYNVSFALGFTIDHSKVLLLHL
jgi:hypothetical protein